MATGKAELDRMKRSLRGWLTIRQKNDLLQLTPDELGALAADEKMLAGKLQKLLTETYGQMSLPADAVVLANLVLTDAAPTPEATGFWPILIGVGLVLMVLMIAISNWADVAKAREERIAIEHGATDTNTVIKWGIIAGIGYLVLTHTNVAEQFGFAKTSKVRRKR